MASFVCAGWETEGSVLTLGYVFDCGGLVVFSFGIFRLFGFFPDFLELVDFVDVLKNPLVSVVGVLRTSDVDVVSGVMFSCLTS